MGWSDLRVRRAGTRSDCSRPPEDSAAVMPAVRESAVASRRRGRGRLLQRGRAAFGSGLIPAVRRALFKPNREGESGPSLVKTGRNSTENSST